MIRIYKGDSTDFANLGSISVSITSSLALRHTKAHFSFLGVDKNFTAEQIQQGRFTFNYTSAETDGFCLGENFGTFTLFDPQKRKAVIMKVIVEVRPACRYVEEDNDFCVNLDNAFDYNLMGNKPSINGVTLEGAHDGRYYGLQQIPAYSEAVSYAAGDQAIYEGSLWICKANSAPGAFDKSKWTLVGASVKVFATADEFPQAGDENVLYIDLETSFQYVWTGAAYVGIGGSYKLPPATTEALGGVIVGEGLSVTEDGVLSADAQPQEQADWTENDSASPAYIKNKPGVATAQTAGFMSAQDKAALDEISAAMPSGASSSNPLVTQQELAAATPADYDQVKAQVEQNTSNISTNADNIATINTKIPPAASASNKLADKAFVNSSIASNTATFRGTFNQVSDATDPRYGLGLTVDAPWWQVSIALANAMEALYITPENNDYCFVQVPKTNADPTIIDRVDRYKYSASVETPTTGIWQYEWSLNNSSFTADQWAAINSGITSGLVDKLVNLPTAEEIAAKGYVLFDPSNGGSDKNHFNATSNAFIVRSTSAYAPTATSSTDTCKGFLIDLSAYAITTLGQSSIVTPVVPADPLTNYIDACHRIAVTSLTIYLRVGSAVNAVSIRALIKSADGSTTLATSSLVTVTSPSSVVAYTFEFPSSTVWYDNGTQYRVEFEYDNPNLTDYAQLYPILGQNSVYTYAANKGVKWSLITEDAQSGETVTEVTDKCVNMTVSATMDVTVTIPVANLLDIGYYGFSPLKKYALNEKCVKDGILYECKNSSGHGPAPWSSNNFRAVLRLDDNITIGKGSTVYGPSTQLKNNIVVGLNTASAAGTNNIVVGYSAKARCTEIGSPTGSDDTSGNVVIGFSAAADNANNTRYAPMDSVVVGKYAKMHGSYGIVLGVAAEVTEDKGVAIGTEALAKGEASAAIGYQASADPDFVNTKAYEVDDIVVQGSYAYKCILAVSAATSLSPNPSPPQDGTHWQLLDGVTISTARSLAVGNDARTTGEGAVAIGSGARAREDNSIAIGNGAKSNGQGTATLAIDALNKFFLGSDNIVDLINAAVNTAIANETIKAAVSSEAVQTRSATTRRILLAQNPADPTGEKTQVTPADIGALSSADVVAPSDATAPGQAADAQATAEAIAVVDAQMHVNGYALPEECFPLKITIGGEQVVSITDNAELDFRASASGANYRDLYAAYERGGAMARVCKLGPISGSDNLVFYASVESGISITFNLNGVDTTPTTANWPIFVKKDVVVVRGVQVSTAEDAEGYLPLTGGTITGPLTVGTRNPSLYQDNTSLANGNQLSAGYYAHAEGANTSASGNYSHAEGNGTNASGNESHAEGQRTYATGYGAHAEGEETTAAGDNSHADGYGAVTAGSGWGNTTTNPHAGAFAWQGKKGSSVSPRYYSHGDGTFNINPIPADGSSDAATGFFIGEQSLGTRLAAKLNTADVVDPSASSSDSGKAADAFRTGVRLAEAEGQTRVNAYSLPPEFFPITYEEYLTTRIQYTATDNSSLIFSLQDGAIRVDNADAIASGGCGLVAYFDATTLKYSGTTAPVTNLKFNGASPVVGSSPSLENKKEVVVRGEIVLGSTGSQTLAGDLTVTGIQGVAVTGVIRSSSTIRGVQLVSDSDVYACTSVFAGRNVEACANVIAHGNVDASSNVIVGSGRIATNSSWAGFQCNSYDPSAKLVILPLSGGGSSNSMIDYEVVRKGDKASADGFGLVKIGSNISASSGIISVPNGGIGTKGVVQLTNTIRTSNDDMYDGSSASAVTPNALSKGLRYMMLSRGSSTSGSLHDRAVQHDFLTGSSSSIPLKYFSFPTLPNDNSLVKDFILDVELYDGATDNAIVEFLGRNETWYAAIPEGDDWTDMMTVMPGQRVRYYFTETGFRTSNGSLVPIYLVARQNIELVGVSQS